MLPVMLGGRAVERSGHSTTPVWGLEQVRGGLAGGSKGRGDSGSARGAGGCGSLPECRRAPIPVLHDLSPSIVVPAPWTDTRLHSSASCDR